MAELNTLIIGGNLAFEPKVITTPSGATIVEMRIGSNGRSKKDGEWVEDTLWLDCKMFGARAESFAKFHSKGSKCLFRGELRQETWEDKTTGKARSKFYMRIDEWYFADSKPKGGRSGVAGAGDFGGKPSGTFEASNDDFKGVDETPF